MRGLCTITPSLPKSRSTAGAVSVNGHQPTGDPGDEVEIPGLFRTLAPFQQGEGALLGADQIIEVLSQWLLVEKGRCRDRGHRDDRSRGCYRPLPVETAVRAQAAAP
jgi:hypothetical protein